MKKCKDCYGKGFICCGDDPDDCDEMCSLNCENCDSGGFVLEDLGKGFLSGKQSAIEEVLKSINISEKENPKGYAHIVKNIKGVLSLMQEQNNYHDLTSLSEYKDIF